MKKIKTIKKTLSLNHPSNLALYTERKRTLIIGSIFLAFISCILSVLNVINGWWFMAATTCALIIGFIVSLLLAIFDKPLASSIVMAIMVAFVFTLYAITGENEGFSCLWILLVPIIMMNLLGLKIGFILSLYYQIFLLFLFYSPLKNAVTEHYTQTFIIRFPILYFAAFGGVTILALQKEYYLQKAIDQAFHDSLTGVFNRTYFMNNLDEYEKYRDVAIIFVDLNMLKKINDSFGHTAGDEYLKKTASLLSDTFCTDSTVARIGGDEFAVVTLNTPDQINELLVTLTSKAAEWKSASTDNNTSLSFSYGVAYRKDYPGLSIRDLIKIADEEMYQNKLSFYQNKPV